jgi:hypothetical protein
MSLDAHGFTICGGRHQPRSTGGCGGGAKPAVALKSTTQLAEPVWGCEVPGAQGVQLAARLPEKVPAGQAWHDVEPGDEKEPAEQSPQLAAPGRAYLPAPHGRQPCKPPAETEPAAQATQPVARVVPRSLRPREPGAKPGAHSVQAETFLWPWACAVVEKPAGQAVQPAALVVPLDVTAP